MTVERIQLRRGTPTQWTTSDPILGDGEVGVELGSPIKFKIGNGSTAWSSLAYFVDADTISASIDLSGYYTSTQTDTAISNAVAALVDSAPSTLDTLNEIATALGDDPNFATTILNAIADKADVTHTHAISDVTNLQNTLNNKADATHTHLKADITDFIHTHTKSEITDFVHTHTKSDITDFSHTHDASEITNTINTVTSTAYTLQASDNGKTIVLDPTGGTMTVTINNVFTVGQRADIYLRGTTATFIEGTGQIESAGTAMATQYTVASIICVASGVYAIVGNVE